MGKLTQNQKDYIKSAREKMRQNHLAIKDKKLEMENIFSEIEKRLNANAHMEATIEAIHEGTITKARTGMLGEL